MFKKIHVFYKSQIYTAISKGYVCSPRIHLNVFFKKLSEIQAENNTTICKNSSWFIYKYTYARKSVLNYFFVMYYFISLQQAYCLCKGLQYDIFKIILYIAIHDQKDILIWGEGGGQERKVISVIIKMSVTEVSDTVARGNIAEPYWCLISFSPPQSRFSILTFSEGFSSH